MAYTQENRLIAIDTPLGPDALLLKSFTGYEGISRLFHFHLDLLAERAVDGKKIIGQPVTVRLKLGDGGTRYFNGYVNRFAEIGGEARFLHYEAELVPWLWYLTRTSDCRIFQNLSVPEIIEKIFRDLGFKDFKNHVQGVDDKREYCVQYRETDFNFVSRLMEQYGIFYFFQHEEKKHTLVLANTPDAHVPCPDQPRARLEAVAHALQGEDYVYDWVRSQELRPARYTLKDFNFETPTTSLEAGVDTVVELAARAKLEIFDYPGEYQTKAEGERLAKLRIEEEEARHLVFSASATCRGFVSGHRFELLDGTPDENGSYVLTEIRHRASVGETYATRRQGGEQENYENQFSCIPHAVPFRPPRVAQKPTVQGAQTAIVVGKKGEEIWTDKYGRVKVQFHWDREGKYDENSSCWIRVAQSWAGKRWGTTFLPRVGQEVIVDFLEGDPDRPIIIGSGYNAEHMPPYVLPGEQSKSTIKTYSSKGGGGFNELRFDDAKGAEQIFVHAERNLDNRVKKDALEWVGQDRHLIVVADQIEQVKGDKHLHVLGNQNEKIDGTLSLEAKMDIQEKVGTNFALEAPMEIHLKAGLNLALESGATLTFKVGGNFININSGGIFIQGTLLMLNSGGSPGVGSGAMLQPPAEPEEADKAEPGAMVPPPQAGPPPATAVPSPQAAALRQAALAGFPFCEKCAAAAYAAAVAAGASEEEARAAAEEAGRAGAMAEGGIAGAEVPADTGEYWRAPAVAGRVAEVAEEGEKEAPAEEKTFVEIELLDDQGQPVAGEKYRIILPDGTTREGNLDSQGRARVDGIDPGSCQVTFPNLPGTDWEGA